MTASFYDVNCSTWNTRLPIAFNHGWYAPCHAFHVKHSDCLSLFDNCYMRGGQSLFDNGYMSVKKLTQSLFDNGYIASKNWRFSCVTDNRHNIIVRKTLRGQKYTKWRKMTKNDEKWRKMTKNDKKWQKMTKNDEKWRFTSHCDITLVAPWNDHANL